VAETPDRRVASSTLEPVRNSQELVVVATAAACEWPPGPGALRASVVIGALVLAFWWLGHKVQDGRDGMITKAGRIEVTARLMERPQEFPVRGSYMYTYVLKYQVLMVHRQDPQGKYRLKAGDVIFVGHYKPWLPRSEMKDDAWGDSPLGGKLTRFAAGEAHRMALDYELQDLAPAGVLDYCYPQGINRFFALWTNPTTF
jgi:hypothetical protein